MVAPPCVPPLSRGRDTPTRRALAGLVAAVLCAGQLRAEPVAVRNTEGLVHGFLVLRTLNGAVVADGDLTQVARGSRVTARLIFRFRDGSVHDETTVFGQRHQFRLISHHLVQRGPAFPHPLELFIDTATGSVRVRYTDDDGEVKTESEHFDLPADLANGLVLTFLKNANPDAPPESFSFVAATPKPRLVKLEIGSAGRDRFRTGGRPRTAIHYVVKVDIGGISGFLAGAFGKEPPDSHVWILGGAVPAFVKSEQPLYAGGPVWRIELVSPAWPREK